MTLPAQRRQQPWWRLSLLAHEQPPILLAQTDRQAFLVKNTPRSLRKGDSYGCDAWLMPLSTLASADVMRGQAESRMVFGLGRSAPRRYLEVTVPQNLLDDAVTFTRAVQHSADELFLRPAEPGTRAT